MSDYSHLCDIVAGETVKLSAAADQELAALEQEINAMAAEFQVEYYGPGVGKDGDENAYRLVVRRHKWLHDVEEWSVKICDGADNSDWRATWTLAAAARLRKMTIIRALPAFLRGFRDAVTAAQPAQASRLERLQEMVETFQAVSAGIATEDRV